MTSIIINRRGGRRQRNSENNAAAEERKRKKVYIMWRRKTEGNVTLWHVAVASIGGNDRAAKQHGNSVAAARRRKISVIGGEGDVSLSAEHVSKLKEAYEEGRAYNIGKPEHITGSAAWQTDVWPREGGRTK